MKLKHCHLPTDSQTQILKAVEKRLEAQNKLKHFQNRLEEERKKVATLNEAAKVMQEEFEVRVLDRL